MRHTFGSVSFVSLHLYEIPITLMSDPSRKHMPRLADKRRPRARTLRTQSMQVKIVHLLRARAQGTGQKEHPMLDLILLALGLGFFVLTIGYAYACDRL